MINIARVRELDDSDLTKAALNVWAAQAFSTEERLAKVQQHYDETLAAAEQRAAGTADGNA